MKNKIQKEIIIYKENGFYSSDLIPKDLSDNPKKYSYFEDVVFDIKKMLELKKEVKK